MSVKMFVKFTRGVQSILKKMSDNLRLAKVFKEFLKRV